MNARLKVPSRRRLSVCRWTIPSMGWIHVRGHWRNGRWVNAYTQHRRGGVSASALSPLRVMVCGAVLVMVIVVVWPVAAPRLRSLVIDRWRDAAPLQDSSWFRTDEAVCEGVAGTNPGVRCQLVTSRRLERAGSDPLCESNWYGTVIAQRSGEDPSWICIDGPLSAPSHPTYLPAGQTARYGSPAEGIVACHAVTDGGISCRDSKTGYGFAIGASGYQINAGIFSSRG